MYLLIFQAWATLMGFAATENNIQWNAYNLSYMVNANLKSGNYLETSLNWSDAEYGTILDWYDLSIVDPSKLLVTDSFAGGYYGITEMSQALMLTNIMTHVSMILIFVFFVCFIVWLFRLFGHMLSRR